MFSETTTPFLYSPLFESLVRLFLIAVVVVLVYNLHHMLPKLVTPLVRVVYTAILWLVRLFNPLDTTEEAGAVREDISSRVSVHAAESEKVAKAVLGPLLLAIYVIGLWLIAVIAALPADVEGTVLRLRDALLSLVLYWSIFNLVTFIVEWFQNRADPNNQFSWLRSKATLSFGKTLARAIIIVVGFLNIMSQLGIDVGALVAGLGIGGIAVALAAQSVFADLFGYFVIMFDNPFVEGDFITTEQGSGHVERILFRSTRLRSPDRPLLVIPNGIIVSSFTTNWTRRDPKESPKIRTFNQTLHLDLGTSADQLKSVLKGIEQILKAQPSVALESLIVHLTEIGESSLNVLVFCDFLTPAWHDFIKIQQDINLQILDILKDNNVSLNGASTTIVVANPTPNSQVG